jgi:hypothetical protein
MVLPCWKLLFAINILQSELAEAVTFLTYIPEMPESIVGRDNDHPHWGLFEVFLNPLRENAGIEL